MKTLHHQVLVGSHTEWHDNIWCDNPEETIASCGSAPAVDRLQDPGGRRDPSVRRLPLRLPEHGADFLCVGMYDFQIVEDVNLALDVLGTGLPQRQRPWMA